MKPFVFFIFFRGSMKLPCRREMILESFFFPSMRMLVNKWCGFQWSTVLVLHASFGYSRFEFPKVSWTFLCFDWSPYPASKYFENWKQICPAFCRLAMTSQPSHKGKTPREFSQCFSNPHTTKGFGLGSNTFHQRWIPISGLKFHSVTKRPEAFAIWRSVYHFWGLT